MMSVNTFLVALLLLPALFLSGCGTEINRKEGAIVRLLDPANIDSTANPAEDFFLFANGNWLKKNPIPPSETQWGSLDILEQNNLQVLRELLEFTANRQYTEATTTEQKAVDFYYSGMDTPAIEKAGLGPLTALLQRVSSCTDNSDILHEILYLHTQGFNPGFSFYVIPDPGNPDRQICMFGQGGLGMPDPEDYIPDSNVAVQQAYRAYLRRIFCLSGDDTGTATLNSNAVWELEASLAAASMGRSERRSARPPRYKYAIGPAGMTTGNLDWKKVCNELGARYEDTLLLPVPAFFTTFSRHLEESPVACWKAYLRFYLINTMAPYLSKSFREAHFDLYRRSMLGQQVQRERWKFVLGTLEESIGEVIGALYAAKTFKAETKSRMSLMMENIQEVYKERIMSLEWMQAETKNRALEKLEAMVKKIGYPEGKADITGLNISRKSFAANVITAKTFRYRKMIGQLGKPTDRTSWNISPFTVNAYYNPQFNEIVFPAGLLQYAANFKMTEDLSHYEIVFPEGLFGKPGSDTGAYRMLLPTTTLQYPYFIENADDAVNYGSIGAFIAHEMTHGFDDKGRYYDRQGRFGNWWQVKDEELFRQRESALSGQFSAFTVLDSIPVNGQFTSRENIADLGGLQIAYQAFKRTKQGQSNEKIDGFTPDQRFFLSWAQLWRVATRDQETLRRISSDHHAPYQWRCNGTLRNFPAFYKAFGIKEGDKMFLPVAQRVSIW